MLKIHSVAIDCCASVGRLANDVARRDGSLADQMRRAMASVALNISEGSSSQGRNRNARYFNAMGSAAEVSTALEVAKAFGSSATWTPNSSTGSTASAQRSGGFCIAEHRPGRARLAARLVLVLVPVPVPLLVRVRVLALPTASVNPPAPHTSNPPRSG